MTKQLRRRRKALVAKALAEDSDKKFGKQFATVIVILWASTRVVQVASGLLSKILGSLIVDSTHTMIMFLVMAIYLWSLYSGFRWLVVFPVFMGGIFVLETFRFNLYYVLISTRYAFDAHLYALTYIVAAYAQILFPIMLAGSPRSWLYFNTVNQITQELQIEQIQAKYEQKRKKKMEKKKKKNKNKNENQ